MAFRELMESIELPDGCSERYRKLTALEKMLDGTLYDDLKYSFETERAGARNYINLRERRPSLDFNLSYEITQDTFAELFGDESFPLVKSIVNGEEQEPGTTALKDLIISTDIPPRMEEAYNRGVISAVAVVVHRADDSTPYYDVLPAKWCEPTYRSTYSNELIALTVTYIITPENAEEIVPGILERKENQGVDVFWYRYIVGPRVIVTYEPMSDRRFARLGEEDERGDVIEFVELDQTIHGFPYTPVAYAKNLEGRQRDIDGPCLWWPARNLCIGLDYNLSEIERGLRYSSDPVLFLKKTGIMQYADDDYGTDYNVTIMNAQTQKADDGTPVRGVTQTIVGEDAKLLEISAKGITEKREFAQDLREYALEVIGGMKSRAEHMRGAPSGVSLDKAQQPLRRVVRRQRRPYGTLLRRIIQIVLDGVKAGILDSKQIDADLTVISPIQRMVLDWPADATFQGAELLAHVQGLQLAAGGAPLNPLQLVDPAAIGAKLVSDIGLHESFASIKGTGEPLSDPTLPVQVAKISADAKPDVETPRTK